MTRLAVILTVKPAALDSYSDGYPCGYDYSIYLGLSGHMGTAFSPKYILYNYMDPLGGKEVRTNHQASGQLQQKNRVIRVYVELRNWQNVYDVSGFGTTIRVKSR